MIAPLDIRLSVVIPVNEDPGALARLLKHLRTIPAGPDEILVIDGTPDKRCVTVANDYACRYLASQGSRGARLNLGAEAAGGTALWFLHADSMPSAMAAVAVREAMQTRAGGYLKFRFGGRRGIGQKLLEQLINWRARIGVPYGDQGLFVSAEAFGATGGFADSALFEEVALIRALRRQWQFKPVAASITVSPRRWERDGWIRRTVQNRLLVLGYIFGVPAARLAEFYRPIDTDRQS